MSSDMEQKMQDIYDRPQPVWPTEASESLIDILGTMCFQFIQLAKLWRETGTDIPKRAENEQAFFLHAMLQHWFDRGDDWRDGWAAEITARIEQAKANRAKP